MTIALSLIFFLSGAAALLFETLWMRLTGLVLGNSVWASSIVLASFMAGLALGNALALRWGARCRPPLRVYALLEILIGVAGAALVVALPFLTPLLAALFARVAEWPWLLNGVRLLTAFTFLLVPTTAMGSTLPLLASSVGGPQERFGVRARPPVRLEHAGRARWRLAGELWLFEALGLRGTGVLAGILDLTAAAGALVLAGRSRSTEDARQVWRRGPATAACPRGLARRERVPLRGGAARARGRLVPASFNSPCSAAPWSSR